MLTTTRLHDDIDELIPGLLADRRYLHENPELGCEEFVTSAFVIDRLRALGVEDALFDHHPGATAALLGGLEEDLHGARELVPAVVQHPGDAHEHRGVGIVAAGVHDAVVERLVLDIVLLVDRERVHVGAQQDDLSRPFSAPDQAGEPSRRDAGLDLLDPDGAEALLDEAGGLDLLEAELGVLVQVPPVGDNAGQDLVDIVAHTGTGHGHLGFLRSGSWGRPSID